MIQQDGSLSSPELQLKIELEIGKRQLQHMIPKVQLQSTMNRLNFL
jgi:hypothetical protein